MDPMGTTPPARPDESVLFVLPPRWERVRHINAVGGVFVALFAIYILVLATFWAFAGLVAIFLVFLYLAVIRLPDQARSIHISPERVLFSRPIWRPSASWEVEAHDLVSLGIGYQYGIHSLLFWGVRLADTPDQVTIFRVHGFGAPEEIIRWVQHLMPQVEIIEYDNTGFARRRRF